MREIPLTQGQVALVDDEDFERVNQFKWCASARPSGGWYARRGVYNAVVGKWTTELLHQFVLGIKSIDHRNGDGLDNQKGNLRPATKSQNGMALQRKRANTTSRFRGVGFQTNMGRWAARIGVEKKSIRLGYFDDEVLAARAYDKAARHYFGEFASSNFPDE